MSTDTPETDLESYSSEDFYRPETVVKIDFARKLERERDAARAELADLRKDKERLDWLQALPKVVLSRMAICGTHEIQGYDSDGCDFCCEKNTIREAIDAAMKEEVES